MVYNSVTQVVMGITKSCYDSFGIPSTIIYGNSNNTNDFTIDQVAPEIDMPGVTQDELKSAAGCIVTFDTTYIQQNFLLEEDGSKQGSEEEVDIEGDLTQNITKNDITQNITKNEVTQGGVNDSQMSEEQPGMTTAKASKFRKLKVRVNLESEDEYGPNTVIRVIRFSEVDDNDINKMTRQTQNMKATSHPSQHQ